MSDITSVKNIDLEPIPGKNYWNTERLWSEEFIYFLLVDRFHDNIGERFFSGEIDNTIRDTTVNHPTALETW